MDDGDENGQDGNKVGMRVDGCPDGDGKENEPGTDDDKMLWMTTTGVSIDDVDGDDVTKKKSYCPWVATMAIPMFGVRRRRRRR